VLEQFKLTQTDGDLSMPLI